MAGKTVVILGGGTGGLVAANRLRRSLSQDNRVVLVDQTPFYSYAPALTRVMLDQRTSGRISRDLRRLEKKGIEVNLAQVLRIEPDRKTVVLSTEELAYDYLVIALGAQYSAEEVPGLNRAWTFYHLDGAEGLRDELKTFESGRVAIVVPRLPYKCPPAPYEGAFLLDEHFRKKKRRDDVEIHVYTPEPAPLQQAGKEAGERILEMLAERDIGFTGGVTAKSVNHQKGLVNFSPAGGRMGEGDDVAPFDMLVATPVHRVPDPLVESGFAIADGWVPVDRETLITNFEDVYCIGDANRVEIGEGMLLPKAGVFAHGEAEVVYRNITAEITGGQPIWAYGGHGACFMETGGNKGAYIRGDFFADPAPKVDMLGPSFIWGLAKTGFERVWLWRWF